MDKVRPLVQREWDQLLIVAAGFLPMCGGDLKAAMSRAIAAHADLIEAIRRGRIDAELPRGRVRLFVPAEGGLALAYESRKRAQGAASYDDLGPPVALDASEGDASFDSDPSSELVLDDDGPG